MSTAAVRQEPSIRAHGNVRVSIPAKLAYDPDGLKKTIGSLVERLGCARCFSGADCFFTFEREYLIDAKGALVSPGAAVELNPQPLPPGENTAIISLSHGARYDINKVFKAVDSVINTLGACPCHSGFDVLYRNELPVIGINEKGEAHQFGG
jgi:hypothetical protein